MRESTTFQGLSPARLRIMVGFSTSCGLVQPIVLTGPIELVADPDIDAVYVAVRRIGRLT